MAYTTKHGRWFPFLSHIDIHDKVLKKFEHNMIAATEYSFDWPEQDVLRHFAEFDFSHNKYKIKIEKKSKIKFKKNLKTGEREPVEALTIYYNYVARNKSKGHSLRYCSPHENYYNSQLPWHHKNHRHEAHSKSSEIIKIYDNDDRPVEDQGNKKFQVKTKNIQIKYFGQIDWPNVKEFLEEVFKLN